MYNRRSVLSLVCGAALAFGCGSSMDSAEFVEESNTLALESVAAHETLLASFDSAGEHHAFVRLGKADDAEVAHRVRRQTDDGPPLSSLEERVGQPLTMLEIFLALAPEGMTPPEELLERHEPQARALGRGREILTFADAP